jgi:DNA-binding transcriptional LysR family regulator
VADEVDSCVRRDNVNDLLAFIAVARERSFTKAAKKAGLSQSALSHTVAQLESRLGIRLLTRTTRAVSPTEAGQRLLDSIGPSFDEIESQVACLKRVAGQARRHNPDRRVRFRHQLRALAQA